MQSYEENIHTLINILYTLLRVKLYRLDKYFYTYVCVSVWLIEKLHHRIVPPPPHRHKHNNFLFDSNRKHTTYSHRE